MKEKLMRMGYFPDFYPDEIVYSVLARYGFAMGLSGYQVCQDFCSKLSPTSTIALPDSLESFLQKLPPHHTYTADEIIDQHTLYPYYAAFLGFNSRLALTAAMKESKPSRLPGAPVSFIKPPYLRYCPSCVKQDRQEWGETYWHRTHQILGLSFALHIM